MELATALGSDVLQLIPVINMHINNFELPHSHFKIQNSIFFVHLLDLLVLVDCCTKRDRMRHDTEGGPCGRSNIQCEHPDCNREECVYGYDESGCRFIGLQETGGVSPWEKSDCFLPGGGQEDSTTAAVWSPSGRQGVEHIQ